MDLPDTPQRSMLQRSTHIIQPKHTHPTSTFTPFAAAAEHVPLSCSAHLELQLGRSAMQAHRAEHL